MTKKKYPERQLIVVSKRRQPSDEGLARLVTALVLYRAEQAQVAPPAPDVGEEQA